MLPSTNSTVLALFFSIQCEAKRVAFWVEHAKPSGSDFIKWFVVDTFWTFFDGALGVGLNVSRIYIKMNAGV